MKRNKSLLLILISLLITGCGGHKITSIPFSIDSKTIDGVSQTPFNEKIEGTLYLSNDEAIVKDDIEDKIWELHKLFDNKHEYEGIVNLCSLNNRFEEEIVVSDTLFYAIKDAIKISKLSQGIFNFTMGGVYDMWNQVLESCGDESSLLYKEDQFTDSDIDNVLLYSPFYLDLDDFILMNENDKTIQLVKNHNGKYKLDFEQIKRGLALDLLTDYSSSFKNNTRINVGYTSQEVYGDSNNEKWEYVLENPSFEQFKDKRLFSLEFDENMRMSVSTDAYKHYVVRKNDSLMVRSDVLDGKIGKANNYYRQVALFSKDCPNSVLDALSSIIFNIGMNTEVKKMIKTFELEYKCNIDFVLSRPYKSNDINSFDISISKNLNQYVRESSKIDKIKSWNVIDNNE